MLKRISICFLAVFIVLNMSVFSVEHPEIEQQILNSSVKVNHTDEIYSEIQNAESNFTNRFIVKYRPGKKDDLLETKAEETFNFAKALKEDNRDMLSNNFKQTGEKSALLDDTVQQLSNGKSLQVKKSVGNFEVIEFNEKVDPSVIINKLSAEFNGSIDYIQPDYVLELAATESNLLQDDEAIDSIPQKQNKGLEPKFDDLISEGEVVLEEKIIESNIAYTFSNPFSSDISSVMQIVDGTNVTVAVIDTGIDSEHPFLNGKMIDGYDFYNDTDLIYDEQSCMDNLHGTHVAGIIAQTAQNAKIMPLKCFQDGKAYTSDLIDAIYYALDHNVDIVNCSWGSGEYNEALREVMEDSGLFFVCAAGNNRMDIAQSPVYPACYELQNNISVTSLNNDFGISYFSNYSTSAIDIAAYGRNIESTYPGGGYGKMSGTSMSAALVTGVAALAVQLGSEGIKNTIKHSADKLSNLQDKVNAGNCLNILNLVNGVSNSDIIDIDASDDFEVNGYQPTPEENWELYCSLDNVQVAVGDYHILVLKANGTVWSWGSNNYGQCGYGTKISTGTPQQVESLTDIVQIAAGDSHSLALKSDGTVWSWGYNESGRLGDGTSTNRLLPVQIPNLSSVSKIYAKQCSMAIKVDGTVYAWGPNGGRYGNGTTTNSIVPLKVENLTGVESISMGYSVVAALKSDGSIWTWGNCSYGELGTNSSYSYIPVKIQSLSDVTQISCGRYHVVALKSNGMVFSWGMNDYGQLGYYTSSVQKVPAAISNLSGIEKISAGNYHTLFLKDGFPYACGRNVSGELGDGTLSGGSFIRRVQGIYNMTDIFGGRGFSVALDTNGYVYTWGDNMYGQLGDGGKYSNSPKEIAGLNNIIKVSMTFYHALALRSDGTVWAWGRNDNGQLGNGNFENSSTPVQVQGLTDVISVAAGDVHSLAVKSDGTVWAWGSSNYGQLAIPELYRQKTNVPVQIPQLTNVKEVIAGYGHSMVIKNDKTLWVFGYNGYGMLGIGDNSQPQTPVQVTSLSNVKTVTSSNQTTIIALEDGSVYACGSNIYGQLGNGTSTSSPLPVLLSGISNIQTVASGSCFSFAVADDKTVYGWGHGKYLGNGLNNLVHKTPELINNFTDVIKISSGDSNTVAVKSDNSVWCWGENQNGESNRDHISIYTPQELSVGRYISDVSAGHSTVLGLSIEGRVVAWGLDNYGQMGTGRNLYMSRPYRVDNAISDLGPFFDDAHDIINAPSVITGRLNSEYRNVYKITNTTGIDLEVNLICEQAFDWLFEPYDVMTLDIYKIVGESTSRQSDNILSPNQSYYLEIFSYYSLDSEDKWYKLIISPKNGFTVNVTASLGETYTLPILTGTGKTCFKVKYDPAYFSIDNLCKSSLAKLTAEGEVYNNIRIDVIKDDYFIFTYTGLGSPSPINYLTLKGIKSGNTTISLYGMNR